MQPALALAALALLPLVALPSATLPLPVVEPRVQCVASGGGCSFDCLPGLGLYVVASGGAPLGDVLFRCGDREVRESPVSPAVFYIEPGEGGAGWCEGSGVQTVVCVQWEPYPLA